MHTLNPMRTHQQPSALPSRWQLHRRRLPILVAGDIAADLLLIALTALGLLIARGVGAL